MTLPAGYSITTLASEDRGPETELEVGGLSVRPDGTVLASTRHGELWAFDPGSGEWSLRTDELHQTLGVWTGGGPGDAANDIWVVQKPELTRLVDDTDAPTIDAFETVCDEWGYSGDFFEFAYGPVRDSEGNFHLNLSLGAEGGGPCTSVQIYSAPWRGWHVRVTPEGEFQPYAKGLRSPLGLGINADDEVFYSDVQGDWVPVCHVSRIVEDAFYGHPHSLGPDPDWPDYENLCEGVESEYAERFREARKPPVAWIPYELAESAAGVTFEEKGAFGPFEGQAFLGDQRNASLVRLAMEAVNGRYQGAVFPFSDPGDFQCGNVVEAFSADGSALYVGQTDRGWGSAGTEAYGVQRVEYDGATTPFAMHSIAVLPSGFRIDFTKAAAGEAGSPDSYEVSRWTYNYHSTFGSGRVNETDVEVTNASVVDGGSAVELELPEVGPATVSEDLTVRGRVYEISADVTADDDSEMAHDTGWYTVHEVPG